jgi:hypothetical protein
MDWLAPILGLVVSISGMAGFFALRISGRKERRKP